MLFRKNEIFQKYSFLSALEKGGGEMLSVIKTALDVLKFIHSVHRIFTLDCASYKDHRKTFHK